MKKSEYLKNVLIYCRESRDDGFVNYERIETQRDILVSYCKNKNLGNIIDIILDDNKSGTDFDRLEPIKERIIKKEVDILLLKDASRLGRNILESLTFTAFLDLHKVELMFESERYDEDMFPLIAWFNERRAKDDSTKIRRVLKHKMEEGSIIIKAPYGYIKNGNELIVDKEAAPVIREIFELYLKGHGKYEIATMINRKGYLTPSQLKSQYKNTNMTNIWNKQHIERILSHVIYTGDMPYGMREKVSFKSKKFVHVDKENWTIIPDHHEAIISKEMFDEAQSRMRKCKRIKPRNTGENLFSGLLFCGRCGSRMYKKTRAGKSSWYSCKKSDQEGMVKDHIKPGYGCSTHRTRESILIEIVENYIGQLVQSEIFKTEMIGAVAEQSSPYEKTVKEISSTKAKIETLKTKASQVYDDKLEGRLPEFLFTQKVDEITKELNTLLSELKELEESLKNLSDNEEQNSKYVNLVKQIQSKGINNQTLSLLFKKIVIFNSQEITIAMKEEYSLCDEEYQYLYENGGVVFIQNFIFTASVYIEDIA